jgi:hypothetical protein
LCAPYDFTENSEGVERREVQRGPFLKQRKSLKCLPLGKLESALAAWFKQACASTASIGGNHLEEKALHITTYLEIAKFSASIGLINKFKRRHNIVYRRAGVLIQKL